MSIEESQTKLREALSRSARPYPSALRERAVRYAEARRQNGEGVDVIARELGIAAGTMWSWLTPPRFRKVEIVKATTAEVTSPTRIGATFAAIDERSGVRIEGLDMPSVLELIRRLR